MPVCGGGRISSDRYRCLKDLQAGFRTLKQREKNNNYSAGDNDCQEAAKKLIADLRELTDSGSDEVLTFGVTERGIVNRLEKELKSSNEAYQKKANELETEKTNYRESKDRLEKELQQRKDEIKLIKFELEENEKAKRILEKDNKSLINETERVNTELGHSEDERRNLEAENKTLTDQMNSLKSELQDQNDAREKLETEYKRQREKDIGDIKALKDEREKLETEKNRLCETTQRQRQKDIGEIKALHSALGQLENEKEGFKEELEQFRTLLGDAEQNQRDLIIALNNREQEVNRLETQIHMLKQECNQARSSIQMHRNTIDKLQKNLTEEKKAKEHALNRLSAAAAHRLRDQNPGITDLSDPNRPLKLAEKVSELYDNEWTNAMENLENLDIQEDKGIRILLKIIKNVFDTCVDFGDTHLESFPDLLALPPVIYQLQTERVLSVKDMSSEMLKPMKDFRKSNAEHAISRLQKYIAAERKSKLKIKQKVYDSCKEYIEKCVELCWMMRIQDPPIYMEAGYQTNSAFDSNKMRSYTKAGKFVHFVVWPTFFLHKDGPLLAKGVVQGSKSEIAKEESSYSSADDTDDDDTFVDAQADRSDDNKSRTDDVSDAKQSDSGNGKLLNHNNITTIDTECIENKGKGKDDKSPAGNQSDQGNGEQTTDKSNTTIETHRSETDDKGEKENVPQITVSNPEKDKLPKDNSNTSNGSNCSDNGDNEAGDDVASLGNDMLQNTSTGTKNSENDGEGGDDDEATGRDEKVEVTQPPTDEREIDL